jgi:hypothetical protein
VVVRDVTDGRVLLVQLGVAKHEVSVRNADRGGSGRGQKSPMVLDAGGWKGIGDVRASRAEERARTFRSRSGRCAIRRETVTIEPAPALLFSTSRPREIQKRGDRARDDDARGVDSRRDGDGRT